MSNPQDYLKEFLDICVEAQTPGYEDDKFGAAQALEKLLDWVKGGGYLPDVVEDRERIYCLPYPPLERS